MNTPLTREDLLKIGASLEDYHKVFYTFWELANVYFSDEIPTACVRFNEYGNPDMLLGREFWDSLNHREKLFVVCHECLHVLLDHGIRNGKEVPGATHELVNVAQDITINEMIVMLFSFDREDLREWRNYCWIDTVFKDEAHLIQRNQTFIYYLKLLVKHQPKDLPKLVDQHSSSQGQGSGKESSTTPPQDPGKEEQDSGSGKEEKDDDGKAAAEQADDAEKKARENFAKKLAEDLTATEIEKIADVLMGSNGAGTMSGPFEFILSKKLERQKVRFTSIIKKLKRTRMKMHTADEDTFTREPRRLHDAIDGSNIVLPGKGEIEKPAKDKLLTALFIDISGSCIEYFPQFQKIFAAFDAEREIFEIRPFGFDTRVFPIVPGDRIHAGGGTNFEIIEAECLKLTEEIGKYPDCVIVITDGDGTRVSPKIANRWIWLLTPSPTYTYLPYTSRKLMIKDVIL